MASPVQSRSVPSTRSGQGPPPSTGGPDSGGGGRPSTPGAGTGHSPLRPLPAESFLDRIRDRVAGGHGPAWVSDRLGPSRLTSGGDPPLRDPAEALDHINLDRRSRRTPWRFVLTGAVVAVVVVVAWWLLAPAPPPVEVSLPAAAADDATSAVASAERPGGSAGDRGGNAEMAVAADGRPGAGSSLGDEGQGPAETSAETPAELVVHASGAVASPGVYRVPAGSRVDDLIRAAGGLALDADVDRVNLAAALVDGERIWVPRRGEVEVPDVVAGGGGTAAAGPGGRSAAEQGGDVVIDLNTATAEELESLPGVGPATAA